MLFPKRMVSNCNYESGTQIILFSSLLEEDLTSLPNVLGHYLTHLLSVFYVQGIASIVMGDTNNCGMSSTLGHLPYV